MKIIRNPFRDLRTGTRVWVRYGGEWWETSFKSTVGSERVKLWDPLYLRGAPMYKIYSVEDVRLTKPQKKVVIKSEGV